MLLFLLVCFGACAAGNPTPHSARQKGATEFAISEMGMVVGVEGVPVRSTEKRIISLVDGIADGAGEVPVRSVEKAAKHTSVESASGVRAGPRRNSARFGVESHMPRLDVDATATATHVSSIIDVSKAAYLQIRATVIAPHAEFDQFRIMLLVIFICVLAAASCLALDEYFFPHFRMRKEKNSDEGNPVLRVDTIANVEEQLHKGVEVLDSIEGDPSMQDLQAPMPSMDDILPQLNDSVISTATTEGANAAAATEHTACVDDSDADETAVQSSQQGVKGSDPSSAERDEPTPASNGAPKRRPRGVSVKFNDDAGNPEV